MVAVVKYNAGNIRSLINALDRLETPSVLTDDHEKLVSADKVIFPGVGEAHSAMDYLKKRGLDHVLCSLKQPFLGICLGMQLMCNYSEENDTECLGIFDECVKLFPPRELVPHIGWNNFIFHKSPLFDGISTLDDMYYAHSYFAEAGDHTISTTDYILPFSSGLCKDNYYGVQFHPEKSALPGQRLLQNFLNI